MPGIPLIRSAALSPYFRALDEIGVPANPWLERIRLPPRARLRPDSLVSIQQVLRFLGALHAAVGLPDLPLRIAQHSHLADLGLWGRRLLSAGTLGGLLRAAVRTSPLHTSGERFWLEAHDDQVLFCHRFDPRLDLGRGEAQILLYSFMRDAIRQVAGPCWSPREITLETPIAGVPDPLGSTVPVRVTGVVSFPIPRHLLRLPMPRILRLARHERTGTAGLQETAPASAFADSLRQLLVSLASTSGLDVRGVAEVANVSVRTLQRRLSRAGVRFRDLQQEAQLAQAIALMQEPALRITDIAFELGYSDAAHFTRAFQRWTGSGPQAFRASLRRSPGQAPAQAS